jgi:hypothetical protein
MPDRCTPEYERTLAKIGACLPYRRARRFLFAFFLIVDDPPWHETIHRRTVKVGAGLEREILSRAKTPRAETMTVSIDAGHVRAARGYQGRTLEVMAALVSNDDAKAVLFSDVLGDADRQSTQLNGVLTGLGMTADTEVTIPTDGANGPGSLGGGWAPGLSIMYLTGFTSRCASSTPLNVPAAGRATPSTTA